MDITFDFPLTDGIAISFPEYAFPPAQPINQPIPDVVIIGGQASDNPIIGGSVERSNL